MENVVFDPSELVWTSSVSSMIPTDPAVTFTCKVTFIPAARSLLWVEQCQKCRKFASANYDEVHVRRVHFERKAGREEGGLPRNMHDFTRILVIRVVVFMYNSKSKKQWRA